MAKISRVSLARKRELEKPDMILDFLQQTSLWVGLHKRETAIAAGAFLTVVIVMVSTVYFSARSEKKAFDQLTQIMPLNVETTIVDANTEEAYQQLNKKHGGTIAGKIAGLKYGDICYQAGNYEKAITAYQKALSDFKDNRFFKTMALNGLGYAYEASGAFDQAVGSFKQILEDPQAPEQDKTLFHLGRLYKLQGDLNSSRDMFSRILADHPDSLYVEIVKESGIS